MHSMHSMHSMRRHLVEDMKVTLSRCDLDHARLLEEVVGRVRALYYAGAGVVDGDELAEPRGVIVPQRLAVTESLQQLSRGGVRRDRTGSGLGLGVECDGVGCGWVGRDGVGCDGVEGD